ncbi:hypothetical protein VHEMI04229 [[Torrubiella] hemipterigena]|uniref:Acetoacetate decarboxylase n=1 Tax=[Torrubiella] hemipterigena TaxID=1531966 RepID=A0A0A1TDP5_9HYPO|nr:hypothetical protein VHEMI04229 [[Torrubiella] hemipterigena]
MTSITKLPSDKASPTIEVEFGGHKVQVPKGGYYDRYGMNPDLDEVAKDPVVESNLDFFRAIPKSLVDSRVGRIYAPNFYYRTSSIQLAYIAPLNRLRPRLPEPLEPLVVLPGYGMVALTFYAYHVCDNDPYNEVSIAIMVRQPGQKSFSTTQLLRSVWDRKFFGHVLALPVNTELARVRGVYGYQLPKWLANIDLTMEDGKIYGRVTAIDGAADLELEVPLPRLKKIKPESAISTSTALGKIDGKLCQVVVRTNPLLAAQSLLPRGVKLSRSDGPLSRLLNELEISTIVRADILKDAQMVLHMPTPLERL